MALGKIRTNKRPGGTSYASTVTTVVFVTLCVLGVWMMTSTSIIPPQATSKTSEDAATNADFSSSSSSTKDLSSIEKPQPAFEDNPGRLPEDAIQSDERSENTANSETLTEPVKETQNQANQESLNIAAELNKVENQQVVEDPKPNEPENNRQEAAVQNIPDDHNIDMQKPEEEIQIQNQQQDQTSNNEQQHEQQQLMRRDREEANLEKANEQEQRQQQEKLQEIQNGSSHEQIEHDEAVPIETHTSHDQTPQEITTNASNEDQTPQDTAATTDQSHADNTKNEKAPHRRKRKPKKDHGQASQSNHEESILGGEKVGIPKESKESKKSWATQAGKSSTEKERQKSGQEGHNGNIYGYNWQLCNNTASTDYIPCLDNEKAIRKLRSRMHFQHRERHCPEEAPTCLVPVPEGYKMSIEWPKSREKIWYRNVPHTLLAEVKGHQNWVKVSGEYLTFPGGGTQFIHGALHYIDFVQEAVPQIAWGKHTRVVLDVGCGVASFGGFLFDRDVLAMSFAPKDEHEAQVQFALERGIPAISAVMGSQRLPFPSRVFDLVHCARCRVPWHAEGGSLLLELNRVLRPGGYFVWSATPVYQTLEEDVQIWKEMESLTKSMCWKLVTIKKDKLNSIGAAIYHKPVTNDCYEQREMKTPPMCKVDDDPNAAWYVPLQSCMHRVPVEETERGSRWPEEWPERLRAAPYWLNKSQMGIYGKPAPEDFTADSEHWRRVVKKTYLNGLGISWANVRNVMDMRAVYGGFAAAMKDLQVWVFNVVNVDSPDTLPIIYERGLFGIYHDWCESFSTYPRSYDLLHADHLFSKLKKRCNIVPVMAEIDRIVRPGGKLIVRDESGAVGEVENILKSLHWEVHLTFSKNQEGLLSAQKSNWRPDTYAAADE